MLPGVTEMEPCLEATEPKLKPKLVRSFGIFYKRIMQQSLLFLTCTLDRLLHGLTVIVPEPKAERTMYYSPPPTAFTGQVKLGGYRP